MFRIDRTQVNLSTTRYVMVKNDSAATGDKAGKEAGAEGEESGARTLQENPDAAVSEVSEGTAQDRSEAMAREIIEKAEAEARSAAEKILSDAHEEAATILLDAREQANEERRAAVEEGFTEGSADGNARGYEAGMAKGYDEGRKDFDEKIEEDDRKLLSLISDIYDEIERTTTELESGVAELSLDIVRKVVDPSDTGSGVFEAMIKNALRQIRTDRKIVIHIGQDEFKRFFPSWTALFRLDGGVTVDATVVEDQTLGEGDIVIDAGEETINAGLETQLRAIELAFNRA